MTESRARLLDCQSRFAMDRPARMVHEQLGRAVMEVELQGDWISLEPREAAKRMMTQLSSRPEFKEAIAMRTESVPPYFLQSAHISDGEAAVEDNLVGCEVTLRGLKSDPGKNGRIGKVKAWLPDRGRFAVVLLDDDGFETRAGGALALKPDNVEKVEKEWNTWGERGVARVEQIPGAGRGVVVDRELASAERNDLLREPAYATVVNRRRATTRCHRCFAMLAGSPLIECPCAMARYCSSECRRAAREDPGDHCAEECAKGGLWTAITQETPVLATRIVRKDRDELKRGVKRRRRYTDLDWRGAWKATREHDERRRGAVAQACIAAVCAGLDEGDVLTACLVADGNTFNVKRPVGPKPTAPYDWREIFTVAECEVASALFLDASMLNHSCEPNCFASFPGREIRIRNTEKVRSGGQLFISYGPVAGGETRDVRRSLLSDAFGFECECDACVGRDRISSVEHRRLKETAHMHDDRAMSLVQSGDDSPEVLRMVASAARQSMGLLRRLYRWPSLTLALEASRVAAVESALAGCVVRGWSEGMANGRVDSTSLTMAKDALLCLSAYAEKRRDRGEADGVVERARDFLVNLLISHRRHKPADWDDDDVSSQVSFLCTMHEIHDGPNPCQ